MATPRKIGDVLTHRYSFAKSNHNDLFDTFARYRQLWKSKIEDEDGDYPWDYSLFNPMVFSTVRSFVARTATGNVGVTLQAWNEATRPRTALNQQLLSWEFQEAQLPLRIARAVFSAAMYGKGFIGTGWLYKKAKVVEEVDDKGKVTRKVTVSQAINRADLVNIRATDVLVANRNITDLQEQPWIIIKRWKTVEEMEAVNESLGYEVYKKSVLKDIKKKKPFVRVVDYGADVDLDDAENADAYKQGVLPILEMWEKGKGKVTEMVDGFPELVVREEDHPFYHGQYPLVDITFFPEDDEFWSVGLVQPIEDLQIAVNSVLNQYLTNARQQLNNMWLTGDTRIPEWEFVSRPNGVIHTSGDINQLREVQHKDITGTSLAMIGELKTEIQRTTGISDFFNMGQVSQGNSTLGGLNLEQQNLDQNLKLFMTMLEQTTITQLARQCLVLNQQFITSEQTIGITGRHGYKHLSIKPDEVSAEFTPIVIPNSTIPKNPMIRLQNIQNMIAMAGKEQNVPIDKAPLWRELIKIGGMTDLDEIVPDDRDEALEENELLKKNVPVECQPNDNHDTHIAIHQYELISGEVKGDVAQRFFDHIKNHKLWKMADDPALLDQMTGQQQPQLPQGMTPPGLPGPGIDPGLGQGGPLPEPNAAVNEQGLMQQLSQQLAPAPLPQAGPLNVPLEVNA